MRGYLSNVSVSYSNNVKHETISINDTKHWLPASTVKLFAAMYAFKKIADHKLNLYYATPADEKNVAPTEPVDNGLPLIYAGNNYTLDRLINQMIIQSDNTAFNMLLDLLDRRAITMYIQSLGLTHSVVGSKLNLDTSQAQYEFDAPGFGINTTTAQDYSKAFALIYQNKIPGALALLEMLKQQKINYMLPLYLPKNTIVAHKHGDLSPLFHDGGIVYQQESPYILSIFSNVGDPNLVAHISELIFTKNPKLVGKSLDSPVPLSEAYPSIDPLVANAFFNEPQVLAAQTSIIQTQPITAADLGITTKDLSLAKPSSSIPQNIIPADSPFHFFSPTLQLLKSSLLIDPKEKAKARIEYMISEISDAKDFIKKGKLDESKKIFKNIQNEIDTLAKDPEIKSDAQAQINMQTVSDTRFQILGDTLKSTTGEAKRNALIKEIGEQAKKTSENVQPNIPLATNALNIAQKPLIGDVVNKNDSSLVIRTAGGQEITIPLNSQTIKIKTRESNQPPTTTEKPTPIPTQSLSNIAVGTTVALLGSSVGNIFTPTFVLANVPKELAAPEPVTVIKINNKDKTMVISENGIPVQVNIMKKTVIRGADTSIGLNEIKPGDVVVVHGEPLVPSNLQPQVTSPAPSVTPTKGKSTSTIPTTKQSPTIPTPTGSNSEPTKSAAPNKPTQTPVQSQSTKSTIQTNAPSIPKLQQSLPKIIQGTTIRIIEKKQDAEKKFPAINKHQEAPKAQEDQKGRSIAPTEAPKKQKIDGSTLEK